MRRQGKDKINLQKLNRVVSGVLRNLEPPEELTVDEWADRYRILPSTSAESGQWRTSRTPYLREPMRAFTDPKIKRIAIVASSQIGKSEAILNMIGYVIDEDPGSILFVQPTLDDAKKFSRLRVAPMIRDSKRLRTKVHDVKAKDSGNTILQKEFPGGMLTITGSNSASALASTPARYIFGDERDRWAVSAGTEGDPWKLAQARQITFYNAKAVEVSTPTIKGSSNIESSFNLGTQERWMTKCPACGEYGEVTLERLRFPHEKTESDGKVFYRLTGPITWSCPHCGAETTEEVMRKQPSTWIAANPEALERGFRSFWLNAFVSPWMPWSDIILEFLDAHDDPAKLQVVFNTKLGLLWENRGDIADDGELLARREDYGVDAKGAPVELPDGVLVLTCGVDTQDNRLEYEVVGYGHHNETWGIRKGYIWGEPDKDEVWEKFDEVIDHVYRFRDGTGLKVSITCIDSGGHYTAEIYKRSRERKAKRVFAIKGQGGDGVPFIKPPSKVPLNPKESGKKSRFFCWLYVLGVDAGKAQIMSSLKVQTPGPNYWHFPRDEQRGYDENYFNGLLSEHMELEQTKTGRKWVWVKLPGHNRNEALDCRNYANAAYQILAPDTFAVEKQLQTMARGDETGGEPAPTPLAPKEAPKRRSAVDRYFEEW